MTKKIWLAALLATTASSLLGINVAKADTITVQFSGSVYTDPSTIPFALENLGMGPANTDIGATTLTGLPGITSITFTGGGSTASGEYTGETASVALSPLGGQPGSETPAEADTKYLVAGGGGGTVTVNYATPQTTLNLLWGTVDTDNLRNVVLTAGGQSITGADINAAVVAAGGSLINQEDDVAVEITGLTPFTSFTASDAAAAAFEFIPGQPIPEPASLALLGVGLAGLGVIRRRKSPPSS